MSLKNRNNVNSVQQISLHKNLAKKKSIFSICICYTNEMKKKKNCSQLFVATYLDEAHQY